MSTEQATKKSNRGFASMDRTQQRAIASKGGRAAHAKGTAHQFSSEEASASGKKGGAAVSKNRKHMAEIGRMGGKARALRAAAAASDPVGVDPPETPMPDDSNGED